MGSPTEDEVVRNQHDVAAASSGCRVSMVVAPTPEVQELLGKTLLSPDQEPLNLFKVLALHPALLKRFNLFAGLFMQRGLLPARTRELVILRVAALTRCEYEWAQHAAIARQVGLTPDAISAVRGALVADEADPADMAVLRTVEELVRSDDISDEAWALLTGGGWTEPQIVELVMLVGCYRMIAGVLNGLRIPVDGFTVLSPAASAGGAQ